MDNVTSIAVSQPKALTGVILGAFFNGTEAKQVGAKLAQIEGSRLAYLFSHFPASTREDVAGSTRDMRKQAETDASGNKKATIYRTATKRAREVQMLYGAWGHANLKPEGLGYHDAVAVASEALKAAGIKWTGEKLLDKDQKAIRQEAGIVASEFVAVEEAKLAAAKRGEELSADEIEQERRRTRDAEERAGAVKMAQTLYRRKGEQFCSWLIEALEEVVLVGTVVQDMPQEQQEAA